MSRTVSSLFEAFYQVLGVHLGSAPTCAFYDRSYNRLIRKTTVRPALSTLADMESVVYCLVCQ